MHAGKLYRPTEDTTGQHRQLLTALADAVLHHAKGLMQQVSPTGTPMDLFNKPDCSLSQNGSQATLRKQSSIPFYCLFLTVLLAPQACHCHDSVGDGLYHVCMMWYCCLLANSSINKHVITKQAVFRCDWLRHMLRLCPVVVFVPPWLQNTVRS